MIKEKRSVDRNRDREQNNKKYKVIMYNDDTTTMEFVVLVLMAVFNYSESDAINLMLQIHTGDKMVVAIYPKKLAIAKMTKTLKLAKMCGFNDFRVTVEEA